MKNFNTNKVAQGAQSRSEDFVLEQQQLVGVAVSVEEMAEETTAQPIVPLAAGWLLSGLLLGVLLVIAVILWRRRKLNSTTT